MWNTAAKRREAVERIWHAGVDAVRPVNCLPAALRGFAAFDLRRFDRIWVVGGGKAGAAMAIAAEGALEEFGVDLARVEGLVNVPAETLRPLRRIRLHAARPMGVNHPTEAAVVGTMEMLRLAEAAGPNDLLLCLISGGGSALLCAPADRLTLEDKQTVTKLLHQCGAAIGEMNCVRKHLSKIKGGGLAQRFFASGVGSRRLLGLVISDVIGDPLDVIASGPTVPDPTTFAEALAVLERFGLRTKAPAEVIARLEAGAKGRVLETLKAAPCISAGDEAAPTLLVANSQRARQAACGAAEALGLKTFDDGDLAGDTRAAARKVAVRVKELRRQRAAETWCIISGGETTVTLPPGAGKGGRNQELALALAAELDFDLRGVTLLCAGTDGEDGPTDAAGALLDETFCSSPADAHRVGLADALARHDAYPFLERCGGLFRTGMTDTNVMDLRVILVRPEPDACADA